MQLPGKEVDDDNDNNLFSVDHYGGAGATYDDSVAIAAAFADPAQPPQSLSVMQKKQTEEQLAAKKIVGYVYKRAPGAPKRWKSSYIHFYTDFCKKKRQGFDGCLNVEVCMYVASTN